MGVIYPIVGNFFYTVTLYLALIFSNLILFLVFSKGKSYFSIKPSFQNSFSSSLQFSIQQSFSIIILVYGVSIYFYIISVLIRSLFPSNSLLYVLINGLFDLTNGVFSTIVVRNINIRSLLILIFISFGTISIHMQLMSCMLSHLHH